MNTQLLLTFTTPTGIPDAVDEIIKCYDLPEKRIYVLLNKEDNSQVLLSYNAVNKVASRHPMHTISVHRKKLSNTLYTINALNDYIYKTTGQVNKQYEVDWNSLRNTALVMAYNDYKIIPTELLEIISFEN